MWVKDKLYSRHKTQNNINNISWLLRPPRFQSRLAESAGHTSCWISVLSVLPHKGTEGQARNSDSSNTCKDKTIYSQRVVETQGHIWERGNERQVGESQLMIRAHLLHDRQRLPRPRAANMTGQQEEPGRHPEP